MEGKRARNWPWAWDGEEGVTGKVGFRWRDLAHLFGLAWGWVAPCTGKVSTVK
ncbi:MAG: hypothetical protein IJ721_02925 [Bacteroidales bacterium]|nr:hypothetical protein [Bacteroidales bacterium]